MNTSVFVIISTFFIATSCNDTGSNVSDELFDAVKKALPSNNGISNTLELAKNELSHKSMDFLKNAPASFDDKSFPTFLNASSLPSIEEGEDKLRLKCLKNGKNDSFDVAMHAKEDLSSCLRDLVDFENISKEIEKYKPTGDLDIVFKKHCKKMPILKSCVKNFTIAFEPCLEASEKPMNRLILNITDSLDKFICFKEGDRIALFIAEGGPECITDKLEAVQLCINQTFGLNINTELSDQNDLPVLKLEESECRNVNRLQSCIVSELEKCSEPTPANIVDSLFNFIRQSTPCAPYKLSPLVSSTSSLFINKLIFFTSLIISLSAVIKFKLY